MDKEYGELSTMLYEFTKPVGYSIEGDIEYYGGELANIGGRVLEAGVGTGRVLIPLIKNGFTVDGVDSSPAMLKQCRRNLKKHNVKAELFEQDLVDLSLPYKYKAIIMPAGSFCLLPREKIQKVLSSFFNHLSPGGKIIIDLEMPVSFQEGFTKTDTFLLAADRAIHFSASSEKIDWMNQKISYINKYELLEKGRLVKREIANFTLYWYGIEEFVMRLALLGFKDITYEIGYGNQQSGMVSFIAYK